VPGKDELVSTEETRHIAGGYVAALQRGDIDALRASFTPEATWTIRGDIPVAGTWTGPDEILDGFLAKMFAVLDPPPR
jgi:ketosteroid isomerase-like protein